MTAPYRDDLAHIHDAGFGDFARNAAPVLLGALRERGIRGGRVVDLGCGGGIVAEAVAAAGYRVLGIDLSAAAIDLARRRVPEGEFRVGSLLSEPLPGCVAVAAIGECVNYLFDPGHSEQAVAALFRRVHDALAPGGVLLFDAAGPGRAPGGKALKNWTEGEDWAVLYSAEEDPKRRLLIRRITTFRRIGEHYRRDQEVHRLGLLPPGELTSHLRAAGFSVRLLAGYGELPFPPGLTGFLALRD